MKLHHSITDLFYKSYELVCADYRDSLDNSLEIVQKAIHEQDWGILDECIDEDWEMDSRDSSLDYILKELKDDIVRNFDTDEDKAELFIDKYRDYLIDEIYERDTSEPLKDMIRNTDNPVCFYDLGVYFDDSTFKGDHEIKADIREIKRALKIKASNKQYDDKLELMLLQASYGGRLVVYFREDINNLMSLSDKNIVTFKNPMIAIIDTYNGSGDNTDLRGHEFTISFTPSNIFLDKCIKYSYTYEVCSMYSNWCDCTIVHFGKDLRYTVLPEHSTLYQYLAREERYNATFKAGKCTPSDMDFKRHRKIIYINDFPCGNKCLDCGTFWID